MRSKPLLSVMALVAGCSLEGDGKNACDLQTDCLPGYVCLGHTCIVGGHGSEDARGKFYGTVEPLASMSDGMAAASDFQTLVAVTTAPGTLGCAVVGDLQASPGPDTAVVYAKVYAQGNDARCPMGVFAIMNDPTRCATSFPDEPRPGCALYKRWDAAGQQAAHQLATGGYVSVTRTYLSDMAYRCSAELSVRFAGGVVVAKTWTFEYNPYGPASSFCAH